MPFKILFFILPLITTSCSQLSKEECQKSRVTETAFELGASGASNRFRLLEKNCKNSPQLKASYQNAYTRGLMTFCSVTRGQEQALLGLEKEKACLISTSYQAAYLEKLESVCNSQKARVDARKLLNSDNRLCLAVPTYKKSYLYRLSKHCSYNKGFAIGLQKKELDQNCKDSKSIGKFKKGHRAGLIKSYKNENRQFQKSIYKFQALRKTAKRNLKKISDPTILQKQKIELNVLESKILELEHQIEKNKSFIN